MVGSVFPEATFPEASFLQAILEEPEEDGVRLVYADWLEERGDTDRAEFIRVQCELARIGAADPRRRELAFRERVLLKKHERAWLGPLRGALKRWQFRRGFLGEAHLDARKFLDHQDALFRFGPVYHVHFQGASAHLPALVGSVYFPQLAAVDLSYNFLNDAAVEALAGGPYLHRLLILRLAHNFLRDRGAQAVAASPHLPNLALLDLTGNLIGDAGRQALLARFGDGVQF
jgi:uncharacterized protein (TIGR02996 family)